MKVDTKACRVAVAGKAIEVRIYLLVPLKGAEVGIYLFLVRVTDTCHYS